MFREFLRAAGIHGHVFVAAVFADDHALEISSCGSMKSRPRSWIVSSA